MTNLVKGSIGAISQQTGKSLAQTFLNVDCVVLVDTSGSMGSHDAPNGRTRYEQACMELANLQESLPGKIAVISWAGGEPMFCANGTPYNIGGGTDLERALKFAKVADVPGMRFIVISDGQPDSQAGALQVAKSYRNRIDTIYVGPETGLGREFLEQLARASGGSHVTANQAKALSTNVQRLLAVA